MSDNLTYRWAVDEVLCPACHEWQRTMPLVATGAELEAVRVPAHELVPQNNHLCADCTHQRTPCRGSGMRACNMKLALMLPQGGMRALFRDLSEPAEKLIRMDERITNRIPR